MLENLKSAVKLDNDLKIDDKVYSSKDKETKLLTKRQLECLSLCAYGFSNSKISKILYISESTVKKTLEEIFRRLKVKGRTSAVTFGFIFGILNPETLKQTLEHYKIQAQTRQEWE